MKLLQTARKLYGLNTLQMIEKTQGIDRARAITLIHRLRKKGYVKTHYQSNKRRVYHIAPENMLGGTSYIDILNKYSPIQLIAKDIHVIYGRTPSIEETLVYAVKRGTVRFILVALSLFRKVTNWSLLYHLAKKEGLIRQIAALYDIARFAVPKVRRMPQRFRNLALPKKTDKYVYIVKGFDSLNYQALEKKWKVFIPLNTADLRDIKFEYALQKAEKRG